MECKKIAILGVFAECHGQGTRQRFFKKIYIISLSSALPRHSVKYFLKKNSKILCRVPKQGHSAKKLFKKNKKNFAECLGRALGKEIF